MAIVEFKDVSRVYKTKDTLLKQVLKIINSELENLSKKYDSVFINISIITKKVNILGGIIYGKKNWNRIQRSSLPYYS